MFKKKYHGLLKVLLLLLFTMLFVCYSTSYASIDEPFSAAELTQINNFFNININDTTLNNAYNYLKNHYSTLSKLNIIFVYGSDTLNGTNYLYLICNNGTYSNEVGYLKFTPWSNTYFKITSVENINSTNDLIFYYTRININTSYITGLESNNVLRIWTGENPPFTLNNSLFTSNRLLTTRNMATFYAFTTNDTIRVVLSTNYIILDDYVQPEEPSGDIPILTGTITNPSGDITGQINLTGIENGITNIQNQISGDSQRIIDNQNQNTESIVGAINNSNENYWGSSGDLTGDYEQQQIEDSLNDIIYSVSGELTNNAVFGHLEQAEDIFLGFFKNKEDESFYDLIISWDAISPVFTMFNGTQNVASGFIISGDSLNISAMCRENQELANIQQYIRIIFNFSVIMALLWQIYNLILSTLGIDNPYLYEDAQVNDVVNLDTGEVRTYYRTRKRVFRRR